MNIKITDRSIVHLVTLPEPSLAYQMMDDPPATGPTLAIRELVLRPGVYRGRRVLRAYDRETDTLYMKA